MVQIRISTIFLVNVFYSCSEKYFFDISFIKKFLSIQLKRQKQKSVTDFIEFKLGLPRIIFEKKKNEKLKAQERKVFTILKNNKIIDT